MASVLAPWVVTPLPKCAILFDRHTHKNGGSTMRSVYFRNDHRDAWTYWGYSLHQYEKITSLLQDVMLAPEPNSSCSNWIGRGSLRIVAEYHYSRHDIFTMLSKFGPSSALSQIASSCACRLILFTRLRKPLDYYLSFYRWTVAWRQRNNATAYGHGILDWAPRNLQSALLLAPLDATWAEYTGVHTGDGRLRRARFDAFDVERATAPKILKGEPLLGPARVKELRRVLDAFDLVGLLDRFDETLINPD